MNDISIFSNSEFGEIRVSDIGGEPWFCLADVCRPLGIRAKDCKLRLKQEGVDTIALLTAGGTQNMLFVNEGNLYRAIFQSHKPEAEQFTDWVTEEVLPAIRKTGTYIARTPMSPAELIAAQANLLVQMEQKVAAVEAHTSALEEKIDNAVRVFSKPDKDHWKSDVDATIKDCCAAHGIGVIQAKTRLYRELEQVTNTLLGSRLKRLRARKQRAGATSREVMALNMLDAIATDKQLRAIFDGVVRRWQTEYITCRSAPALTEAYCKDAVPSV